MAAVRQEPAVWMDETRLEVDAVLRRMCVAVSPHFTVYAILSGRGFARWAEWIKAHSAPSTVITARIDDIVYHYSHRRVIWYPTWRDLANADGWD